MSCYLKKSIGGILMVWIAIYEPARAAQEPKTDLPQSKTDSQQPQQPLSAAGIKDSTSVEAVVPYSNPEPEIIPDTRPLSGFQQLSLGTKNATHSFLLPSFTAVAQVQTNPLTSGQSGGSNLSESGTITGRLALNRVSAANTMTLDYLAGATFANGFGQGTSGIQSLDFSDAFQRGRWSLMGGEELTYLSQSPFGFGGLGGLNGYGVPLGNGGTGTSSGLAGSVPDQSILTNATRVSNAAIGQAGYLLTHRSSLSFGVDYGFLKFIGSGLNDNSSLAANAGYNYQLSRSDSISLSNQYSRFMYPNGTPGFETESVLFGYARRITGRMSFQASGGLQLEFFTLPLKGPSNVVGWSLLSSMSYARGGSTGGISYSHGLSGGAGVLRGAETDTVSATFGHAFNHDWNSSVSAGYARSQTLQQTTTVAQTSAPGAWFFSVRANRRLFASGSFFVNYGLSKQSSLSALCSLPACQFGSTTHTGSVGYTWGLRQIVLE